MIYVITCENIGRHRDTEASDKLQKYARVHLAYRTSINERYPLRNAFSKLLVQFRNTKKNAQNYFNICEKRGMKQNDF